MLADESEPTRLRALLTLMREFGLTRLVTCDGFTLEKPPGSSLASLEDAAVVVPPASAAASSRDDPDDLADIEREERDEKQLERQWNGYWQKLTLSSGAPTPTYPGPEKAKQFLGRWQS